MTNIISGSVQVCQASPAYTHTHTHTLHQGGEGRCRQVFWGLSTCSYLGEWHSVANCHMATLNIVRFNKRVHTLAINKLVWGSLGYHELSDFSLCPCAARAWWPPAECHFRSDSSLQQQEILCPADRTQPLMVILPLRSVFLLFQTWIRAILYVLEYVLVHKIGNKLHPVLIKLGTVCFTFQCRTILFL